MKARPERQFYFRLAGHLGLPVRELLARMTSRELSEWMAYERVAGPLGGQRIDIAAAVVASTLANIYREKRSKTFTLDDFIPEWRVESSEQMTPDAIWSAIENAHRAYALGNGKR